MVRAVSWLIGGGAFAFAGIQTFSSGWVSGPGPHALPLTVYLLDGLLMATLALVDILKTSAVRESPWVPGVLGLVSVTAGAACAFPHAGPMVVLSMTATLQAGGDVCLPAACVVAGTGVLATEVAALTTGAGRQVVLGHPLLMLVVLLTGHNLRSHRLRAEESAAMLAQVEQLRAEQRRVAVLGERTRIAREIHDVLAHSLGALGIEIQVARALMTDHRDTARALDTLAVAQRMAADGLAETRRAVHALRMDTPPLDQELAGMTRTHHRRHGVPVSLRIDGPPCPLPLDQTLSLVRTAGECLTNAAKHAPAQPVDITVRHDEHEVTLTIGNPLARGPGDTASDRSDATRCAEATGSDATFGTVDGGYGLTGTRERLLLLGGSLTAGVQDDRWVVTAQVPR